MYLGDGLAGSCKIQRWLESYSCVAGTSRRRVLGRVSKTSLCGKASGQFWKAGNCREISLRPRALCLGILERLSVGEPT
jgi:hypothetical protein